VEVDNLKKLIFLINDFKAIKSLKERLEVEEFILFERISEHKEIFKINLKKKGKRNNKGKGGGHEKNHY